MRLVTPQVYLIEKPALEWDEIRKYLKDVGGESWADRVQDVITDGEAVIELGGRLCYRSWEEGLNVNVTKVRKDSKDYLGNILKSGHGCYDEETEVLTSDGWRRWPDVTKRDSLATRRPDGEIEYHHPSRLISYHHQGRMFRVESKGVDLLVTPDHRMLICPTTTREGRNKQSFSLVRAQDLGHVSAAYIKRGSWSGKGARWTVDEAKVLGFAIGDGYCGPDGVVEFNLRKPRKIAWLHDLLVRLDWHWTGTEKIRVKVPSHVPMLEIYTSNREKQIPPDFLSQPVDVLQGLFEGLMESDGHRGRTGDSFDTTSDLLVGQFQHLCLHLGMAANICYRREDRSGSYGEKPLTRISIITRNLKPEVNRWSGCKGRSYWVEDWEGQVWCAEVPNHTLYVRRNGIPVWSGNSVLEHANYSFIFHNVSRVFTHEMVRHRAGVAVSQESMRFVRLTDIPFWFPDWAHADSELMERSMSLLHTMEEHQRWMADRFGLDDEGVPFHEKKHKTSFMRRFAPDGVATGMLCTINVRALRHIIYMRTALGAEEEIRLVMDAVAEKSLEAVPNLMQDYSPNEDREWVPTWLKV